MPKWPISDERARRMYAGGRANEDARWYARFWGRVFSAGLFPRRWVTLEVPGRISGKVTSLPLGMADLDGRWYLVSMLGECNWVSNVRANDGDAVLRRRRRRRVHLSEVPVERRAAVLARYVAVVPGGRPHFPVTGGAPLEDFAAIADRYPVFEVDEPV
jgi:deazaflavin-dependent oxidoreductase (nitroreductase family)